jgi:hypothetical protein
MPLCVLRDGLLFLKESNTTSLLHQYHAVTISLSIINGSVTNRHTAVTYHHIDCQQQCQIENVQIVP